jgi:hypothetical protein
MHETLADDLVSDRMCDDNAKAYQARETAHPGHGVHVDRISHARRGLPSAPSGLNESYEDLGHLLVEFLAAQLFKAWYVDTETSGDV